MLSWSLRLPVPAGEDPVKTGISRRLQMIGQILDESRDLLDSAAERHTEMEASLRRAEGQTRDLQWDAAKILLDDSPSRPAMRTVEDAGDQLTSDLRRAQAQAEDLHDTLRQARGHLEHAVPLVRDLTQLTNATGDPEQAVAAAMLATRLERLTTLVELATPLPERTGTRIEEAHSAVGQLRRVTHRDEVRRDAAPMLLQIRNHVAPQVRRGGVAVQGPRWDRRFRHRHRPSWTQEPERADSCRASSSSSAATVLSAAPQGGSWVGAC